MRKLSLVVFIWIFIVKAFSQSTQSLSNAITTDTANTYAIQYCSCMNWYYQSAIAVKQNLLISLKSLKQSKDKKQMQGLYNVFIAGLDSSKNETLRWMFYNYDDILTAYTYSQSKQSPNSNSAIVLERKKYDERAKNCTGNLRALLEKLDAEIEAEMKLN